MTSSKVRALTGWVVGPVGLWKLPVHLNCPTIRMSGRGKRGRPQTKRLSNEFAEEYLFLMKRTPIADCHDDLERGAGWFEVCEKPGRSNCGTLGAAASEGGPAEPGSRPPFFPPEPIPFSSLTESWKTGPWAKA